jgi:hypothetical protein
VSGAAVTGRRYRGSGDTLCNHWRIVVTIMTERPPAIDAPPTGSFEEMLRIVEELDTPAGYKAELIRGKIVVSLWSKLRYRKVMKSLRLQLEPHAPEGHDVDVAPFLFTFPGSERACGRIFTSPTSPRSMGKAATPTVPPSPSSPS